MSDEPKKPNVKRWGRYEWGAVVLLAYLWSWLVLLSLARTDVLGQNETLGWICFIVYWPILQLGRIVVWIQLHMPLSCQSAIFVHDATPLPGRDNSLLRGSGHIFLIGT
jgi:hypothetical protein